MSPHGELAELFGELMDAPELDEDRATELIVGFALRRQDAEGDKTPIPPGFIATCLTSVKAFHAIIQAARADDPARLAAAKAQVNDMIDKLGAAA